MKRNPEFSFEDEPEFSFEEIERQNDAGSSPEFSFDEPKTPEERIAEETGFVNEWIKCPMCQEGHLQKIPVNTPYKRLILGAIRPLKKPEEFFWGCNGCNYGETEKKPIQGK